MNDIAMLLANRDSEDGIRYTDPSSMRLEYFFSWKIQWQKLLFSQFLYILKCDTHTWPCLRNVFFLYV